MLATPEIRWPLVLCRRAWQPIASLVVLPWSFFPYFVVDLARLPFRYFASAFDRPVRPDVCDLLEHPWRRSLYLTWVSLGQTLGMLGPTRAAQTGQVISQHAPRMEGTTFA